MEILVASEETVPFECGRLDKARASHYILMYTTPTAQRQEFYSHDDVLISARNRRKTTLGWSKWEKEVGEDGNHGRSVVLDVVCLRRRGNRRYYW